MWLAASYRPTAAFSLRSSATTSSGGRTNLVPTMYAVKVALIDAAYRAGEDGASIFPIVRDVPIRFQPPARAVVTNTFVKILREARAPAAPKSTDGGIGPAADTDTEIPPEAGENMATYTASVGFRELCHFFGTLTIAFDLQAMNADDRSHLESLLPVVNYFGKRSSFFQFDGMQEVSDLDATFSFTVREQRGAFPSNMLIQYLDDMGPKATFGAINTFSAQSAKVQRDRILVPVALPYRRVSSSRGYTAYERLSSR
ncbi:MAG: type I-A CRISPR-associated protein Cas5 [Chloroflexota bacterium]